MKFSTVKMVLFFSISALLFTACGGGGDKKEDPKPVPDTENPTIVTTLPAATGQAYSMTGSFLYSGTFKDNEALAEVEFSLNHNKTNPSASLKVSSGVDDPPWEPTKEGGFKVVLSGKEQKLENKVLFGEDIPSSIWTGTYTLTITCTDKAGNKAVSNIDVTIQ